MFIRKLINKIEVYFRYIQIFLTIVSWTVTILLTLIIIIDVTGRYFFNKPLPATWEFGEICMPHIVFLPFAYTLTKKIHVRVLLIKSRFPFSIQQYLKYFTDSISLAMCSLITYYSWLRFLESFRMKEEMMAATEILWWWGKIAMPIGMGIFTIGYLWELIETSKNRIKNKN